MTIRSRSYTNPPLHLGRPLVGVIQWTTKHQGFTLIELAVVVFIIGLLASLGLSALNAQMTSAAISGTKKKEDVIKDALVSYLRKYRRLPCPAIDKTGIESRDSSVTAGSPNCRWNYGLVPYATLGLPKSAGLDGWENFFSYAVAPQWAMTYSTAAPTAGGTTSQSATNSFGVGDDGAIIINDRTPATNATPTQITNKAVLIIVSHGKNGLGAYTIKGTQNVSPPAGTDELANVPSSTWTTANAIYSREYTDINVPTYGAFDDVILWLGTTDLITPLVKDGSLKSAEAQWADQITNINNAIIGSMLFDTRCAPPQSTSSFQSLLASNNIPTTDPWGGTLNYSSTFCRLNQDGSYKTNNCSTNCGTCTSSTASTVPFSITSSTTGVTFISKTLWSISAANPNFLNNCPNP